MDFGRCLGYAIHSWFGNQLTLGKERFTDSLAQQLQFQQMAPVDQPDLSIEKVKCYCLGMSRIWF